MATKRRHRTRLNSTLDFNLDIKPCLESGPLPADAAMARQWWQQYRDTILTAWMASAPGTRPFAWWTFDAPEPLRHHTGDLPNQSLVPEFGMTGQSSDAGPIWESQRSYLARHGLISPEELAENEKRFCYIAPIRGHGYLGEPSAAWWIIQSEPYMVAKQDAADKPWLATAWDPSRKGWVTPTGP